MPIDIPPVTKRLIFANLFLFLVQQANEPLLIQHFALWPFAFPAMSDAAFGDGFRPWQLVTYSFLHGGGTHLAFNVLALYMFGSDLERVWGAGRYFSYYLVCVVAAAVCQLAYATLSDGPENPTVGASGGVFGMLLAFGMYFPRRTVMLLIPPIPLPAWLFVTLYGFIELALGVTGTQAGVAHFAHLGGMLGGLAMILFWRGRFPPASRRMR